MLVYLGKYSFVIQFFLKNKIRNKPFLAFWLKETKCLIINDFSLCSLCIWVKRAKRNHDGTCLSFFSLQIFGIFFWLFVVCISEYLRVSDWLCSALCAILKSLSRIPPSSTWCWCYWIMGGRQEDGQIYFRIETNTF